MTDPAQDLALKLIDISHQGLLRTEPESAHLLEPLKKRVEQSVTSADIALAAFIENGCDMAATVKQTFLLAPEVSTQPDKPKRRALS